MTDSERRGVKMLRAISQVGGKDRCSKKCLAEWQGMSIADRERIAAIYKPISDALEKTTPNVSDVSAICRKEED